MASTYSDLKIELIGTGDQTGTWGTTTNNNFSVAISEAITGSADVAFSSADVTVTLTDSNAAQTARNLRLNLTGTSGGARNLILGSGCQIEKLYLINNGLAHAVTVKNTSGTGIAVPAGKSMFVYNNATNVVDAITHLSSLTLGSALPVASGGTGVTASTGSVAVVLSTSPTIITSTLTGYTETVVAIGTVTTAHTFVITTGTVQTATLTASTACTFTMPTATAGTSFILRLTQATSPGSGTATFTGVKFAGGTAPTITATASAVDIISFIAVGSTWYGSAIQDLS